MTKNIKQNALHQFMNEKKLDAVLIMHANNRLWVTTFSSSAGIVFASHKEIILYLDSRYIIAGKAKARNIDKIISMPKNNPSDTWDSILEKIKEQNIKTIGVDGSQTPIDTYNLLVKKFSSNVKVVPVNINSLRMIKTKEEIDHIKKAVTLTDNVFRDLQMHLKPGVTEKEIEACITNLFFKFGAKDKSFPSIVVSGARGALPHGQPSDKKLKKHELVTIDIGCYVDEGYCSDVTRTFSIGQTSGQLKEIFKIVAEAQLKGIKAIKPGVKTQVIHKICLDHITHAGYGEYFNHSTGHGIGINVHESPFVSLIDKTILKPGMVITVEPGIYIPEIGGVRIEDDVLVTEESFEVLSKTKRYNSDFTPIDVLK